MPQTAGRLNGGRLCAHASKGFDRRQIRVEANKHRYLVGLQHRYTGHGHGDKFWRLDKASIIYILQNDAGAEKHPKLASPEFAEQMIAAFDC